MWLNDTTSASSHLVLQLLKQLCVELPPQDSPKKGWVFLYVTRFWHLARIETMHRVSRGRLETTATHRWIASSVLPFPVICQWFPTPFSEPRPRELPQVALAGGLTWACSVVGTGVTGGDPNGSHLRHPDHSESWPRRRWPVSPGSAPLTRLEQSRDVPSVLAPFEELRGN